MVGDLQKNLANTTKDSLPQFINIAITHLYFSDQILDPSNNHLPVCNNACWCLGEMAVSDISAEIVKPYTSEIVKKLAAIYDHKKLNKSLAQNISITLGRLGLINPESVAPFLSVIAKQWCVSLRFLKSSQQQERVEAYKGLCYTVSRNSKGITKDFAYFCSAIAYFKNPPTVLDKIFNNMLQVIKDSCGEEHWRNYISQFPEDLKLCLINRYNL